MLTNPPSYDQDQFNRLQNELQQVRQQLSEVQQQSRPSNPTPSPLQVSNPARYIIEEVPNYAFSQATSQAQQHHVNRNGNQNPPRLEYADAITLLHENGWDATSWELNGNLVERNCALYWAATNGHVTVARYLVRNGASGMSEAEGVDWRAEWRNSALGSAAAANHVEIVQMLLEQATEENLRDNSALSDAAKEGHVDIVRLLLGKWPSRGGSYDYSRAGALAFAAEKGDEEIVRLILEKGVDLTVPLQMDDRAPLCRAAGAGQTSMVKLLLDQNKPPAPTTYTIELAMSMAMRKGHDAIVRMLLDLGVVTNFVMPMYDAVESGNLSILRQVLAAGGRPTPFLGEAVNKGNQPMVELLLEYGAEACKGLNPAAFSGKSSAIAGILLDHGAAVDVLDGRKSTPLHTAASRGRKEVAELLLKRGANIAALDDEGKTPLYFAVISRQPATVGLLWPAEHGAATSSIREDDRMQKVFVESLINGAENGALNDAAEVIQPLIKYGFHFNFNAGSDEKVLGVAAEKGFQTLVQLLLDNGADIKGQDSRGRTALHLAAMNGHYEIVKLLLERGANPKVVNKFGRTAEYWAVTNGHTRVAQLLHRHKPK
ncbi:hypothetical protein VF21_01161 [Pseudogymnoascus sp. 05NY08]|nr:hypothetical protein VF21_01161 [Pseudogymnoascus sp. 05NY08]